MKDIEFPMRRSVGVETRKDAWLLTFI
jgi:hypothetical protein